MPTALSDLNPQTFQDFMGRVQADPALRVEVIRGIADVGFIAVLKQHFTLSASQQKQLDPLAGGGGPAKHWDQLLTMALNTGGDITLVHGETRQFDLELHADILGAHIDVSIHCS